MGAAVPLITVIGAVLAARGRLASRPAALFVMPPTHRLLCADRAPLNVQGRSVFGWAGDQPCHPPHTPRAAAAGSGGRGESLPRWTPQVLSLLESLRDPSRVPNRARFLLDDVSSPLQQIDDPFLRSLGVRLSLKRDDLIHPEISGNKWRKLKYNVLFAASRSEAILTFGGAYSNHISATAAVGAACGITTIGIIRGDELKNRPLNPTLQAAESHGMKLHYVPRDRYRMLTKSAAGMEMLELTSPCSLSSPSSPLHGYYLQYGPCHVVPEGGSNLLGVCGCSETLASELERNHHVVGVACGTGATLAGLAASADAGQQIVIGFPVLKAGGFIRNEAEALLVRALGILPSSIDNRMQLYLDAHCGGYAKMNPRLIAFMRRFHDTTGVKLDPIYTAKLLLGIYDMAEARLLHERARHHLPSLVDTDARDEAVVNVLAVHTGGLQGLKGVEEKIGEKIF